MPRAPHIEDRVAEIELRILIKLYEADQGPMRLRHEDVVDYMLDAVGHNEVSVRLAHLMSEDEVHGVPTDYGVAEARLSPLMRQRLNEPASPVRNRDGETWISRIRWLFERGSDPREIRVTRKQVFDRGYGQWSAVGPA